jgi:hypothetical protein
MISLTERQLILDLVEHICALQFARERGLFPCHLIVRGEDWLELGNFPCELSNGEGTVRVPGQIEEHKCVLEGLDQLLFLLRRCRQDHVHECLGAYKGCQWLPKKTLFWRAVSSDTELETETVLNEDIKILNERLS